jgi:hypothetical protein
MIESSRSINVLRTLQSFNRLKRTDDEVFETHRMLGIPMAGGSIDPLIPPSNMDVEAMQERIDKAKS